MTLLVLQFFLFPLQTMPNNIQNYVYCTDSTNVQAVSKFIQKKISSTTGEFLFKRFTGVHILVCATIHYSFDFIAFSSEKIPA